MNWSLVLALVVCGISPSFGDVQSPVFWSVSNLAYPDGGSLLFSEQAAEATSGLKCYTIKSGQCVTLVNQADPCATANALIECMKEKAKECAVETTSVVVDARQRIVDICKEGSELNKDYLKYKTCLFGSGSTAAGPCMTDLVNEITKSSKRDADTIFKIACKYTDSVSDCMDKKMDDTCGKEAGAFFRKYKGAGSALEKAACNGATSFNFISTLLLQVSAVFFALKFTKNYI